MLLSNRAFPLQPILITVVLLLGVGSLCVGQYPLSLRDVFSLLSHYADSQGMAHQVVWTVRLPRILMALLAGGALGLCGATLQGVFHNPLVDPHIIGVTSGSAFGGTLAILLGLDPFLMMGSTFFFGLAALILVYAIAALQGLENTLVLILSGIILSGFFAALVSLIQYQADTEETLPSIVFWLLGSFATANWHKVWLLAVPVGIAAMLLYQLRWRINLLSLNDKDAKALGVAVVPLRRSVLLCCALLVAAQVSVSGSIAWVGLVIPHLARLLVGVDHRRLLPCAFWLGGGFMIVVDDIARTLLPAEIPLGIITAFLGAPLFAFLLIQSSRRGKR
ncbi:iron ABC transporter permease [Citrobacter freundii]|nr:iron ABC transporter permease [Citrobacter freundii]EJB8472782.1 iron ABC transporter permease [Citrobacter freundii]EJB8558193.1 iron ABC transporter permease [Citrobacter freundii]MBA8033668.1 iron ABC transporter permease [Citrobacter freundii]QLO04096.1 iron ABC transporter permease [Citrobacter freundii]QLU66818.1 iron ABC transporter permease [Citrobacter freundii]